MKVHDLFFLVVALIYTSSCATLQVQSDPSKVSVKSIKFDHMQMRSDKVGIELISLHEFDQFSLWTRAYSLSLRYTNHTAKDIPVTLEDFSLSVSGRHRAQFLNEQIYGHLLRRISPMYIPVVSGLSSEQNVMSSLRDEKTDLYALPRPFERVVIKAHSTKELVLYFHFDDSQSVLDQQQMIFSHSSIHQKSLAIGPYQKGSRSLSSED